ncbi:polynucleotide adenylyltransferase PcnB [Parazoarcus communis]|uniref:Poly(A) polymerase I n=1 Tax=Parazoarcus communis SWub3 = DSM 12120 TaxID=1121029 RepID=A0A323UVI8_9RHOO|nr:polynucleotide adenylyltransferase PcnB [Parazoarcus communis]NMG72693.1 polynucleotide adenylyltransferase PcnB [Parazoarcus communis SWub3 = DSM 12120]PZA16484.1 polynucleotide adenylyltransferase PcnB [Azoarcus communis] [Parazoarcus communis SWub3 = DSM 12120]
MIRKLLRKVFTRAATPVQTEPALIPVEQHGIRREQLSPAARKVCAVLQEGGHKAYVVGGAVRDLLIGHPPKDYDVATSATPEQVRALFRRSRIIGRRFKIVHVMSGPETIEVSTFRASQDAETDEHGRVLHDNVYGSQAEDATRRDFTVNALYYDPTQEVIVDYHHGVADLKQKTLRMIGDPRTRYREDPVRMLRAVRLGAKLGLSIDPAARTPIREMAVLLENVPAARLFDEMLKLLFSGYAVKCLTQLREEGLHHGLLPLLDVILEQPMGERFVWLSLENTDERVRQDKSVSPGFLFATLLWHEVLKNWEARKAKGEYPQPALFEAMDEVLDSQARKLAITRRIAGDIKDIWALQPRFDKRVGKTPYRLIEQPRYRAGWDFLRLRAQSGEISMDIPDWWDRFAHAGHEQRDALLRDAPTSSEAAPAAKKRRRKRRKPAGTNTEASIATSDANAE